MTGYDEAKSNGTDLSHLAHWSSLGKYELPSGHVRDIPYSNAVLRRADEPDYGPPRNLPEDLILGCRGI